MELVDISWSLSPEDAKHKSIAGGVSLIVSVDDDTSGLVKGAKRIEKRTGYILEFRHLRYVPVKMLRQSDLAAERRG